MSSAWRTIRRRRAMTASSSAAAITTTTAAMTQPTSHHETARTTSALPGGRRVVVADGALGVLGEGGGDGEVDAVLLARVLDRLGEDLVLGLPGDLCPADDAGVGAPEALR